MNKNIATAKDKLLFTPGPLTTSRTVKQAMQRDLGSRDFEFIEIVKSVRSKLLKAGNANEQEYTTIILQGAGTYSVEAVISSTVAQNSKILVVINGAYGKRIRDIANVLKIGVVPVIFKEEEAINILKIEDELKKNADVTHICMVHCETSTGMFNPIKEVGSLAKKYNKIFFVDAMSSFGGVTINLKENNIDYIVSSANKCIEGVPGFGFVIAKKESLIKTEGFARSLSFDLYNQWKNLESSGQFRFTPPTHSLIAYNQALIELDEEGGVPARMQRYQNNYNTLVTGMRNLGFKDFLKPELQGFIITAFMYPNDKKFDFNTFYQKLNDRGFVIYPGKVAEANCFRIGNIGRIFKDDILSLLAAIKEIISEMGFDPAK